MEDKIGVFICTGYGIAEALDIDALCKVATDECNVPFCRTVDSCEGPGLESINEDIASEGLTKVVDRRDLSPALRGRRLSRRRDRGEDRPAGTRRLVPAARREDTQMLAEDYLRMYIAKVQKMEPLEPFPAGRSHRQEHPRGRRRHHRHDRGPGSGQGRLRRPPGREDRQAGRLAGEAAQIHPHQAALSRAGGDGRRRARSPRSRRNPGSRSTRRPPQAASPGLPGCST